MGDVFEVEHTLLGKRFALKRLGVDMASDRDMVERFLREARAAAATGHPGIVDVIDLGFAEDGLPYLVMEKLVGETLRKRLDRGALDEKTLTRLGRAVLGALAAVHREQIIHRDIKPENLFLCRDGSIKILDFGLSHRATVDVRLTQSGAVMGTPLYMAPEQARGEECDARTDLYAVGAVLYECATGRPPFTANAYSVLVSMILEIPPNPDKLAALSEPVREVILAALGKKRDGRPADAAMMRAALGGDADDDDVDDARWTSGISEAEALGETMMSPRPGAIPRVVADEASAPTMLPPPSKPPPAPAPTPAPEPALEPEPAKTEVAVRSRAWIYVVGAIVFVALGVGAFLVTRSKKTAAKPAAVPAWMEIVDRGDLQSAVDAVHEAALKAPKDLELQGRDLLLALVEDRTRAYAQLARLEGAANLPPFTASIMAATRAVQRGQPALGAEVLAAPLATVKPGTADELLLRHARAELWRLGDRFDLARPEYEAVLAGWPGCEDAVESMMSSLVMLDDIDAAQRMVEAFVAATPTGADTEMVEIELLFAQRKYTDALARIDRRIASSPGRETEAYQFQGDLRLLLGQPTEAISAYDAIDDDIKRDGYVAGALMTQNKNTEARALLIGAMQRFPKDGKLSRLSKLMTDASLLALETGDAELADAALAAIQGLSLRDVEPTIQHAAALALGARKRLGGEDIQPSDFLLGDKSPIYVLLIAREGGDHETLMKLREVTAPAGMHFGVITTHVYPALWLERARLELAAGEPQVALDWVDRVIRPRHYDTARGALIGRALSLKAEILDAMSRSGEAEAVRKELEKLQPGR